MILEKACAKINLGLDILGKRSDGYHNIDTVMQSVSLCDIIALGKTPGITIHCNNPSIPTDITNTAYVAAEIFFNESGIDSKTDGVLIHIEKSIPSKAGLGGGSSDAAAVFRGLNKLYCTKYSIRHMEELALSVGSDVPFCITGGTQRVKGRGEILIKLPSIDRVNIVICMPDESVNTAHAYSLYENTGIYIHPDMDMLQESLCNKDWYEPVPRLANVFENLVFPEKPAIEKVKRDILDTGARAASMTGSGAAVYGIYSSLETAKSAHASLLGKYRSYLVETMEECL